MKGCAPAVLTPARPRQTGLELAAVPSAVPWARRHVWSVAAACGRPDLSDTAELLASEMITNAVQEYDRLGLSRTPVVRLWVTSDRRSLVLYVWDASGSVPVLQEPGPGDDTGRGLMIIDALSADWGCYREGKGKIVWARITGDAP